MTALMPRQSLIRHHYGDGGHAPLEIVIAILISLISTDISFIGPATGPLQACFEQQPAPDMISS